MRVICFMIGLLRAFGRYSSDKNHPLISAIYPVPFLITNIDVHNNQIAANDRFVTYFIFTKFFRLAVLTFFQIVNLNSRNNCSEWRLFG